MKPINFACPMLLHRIKRREKARRYTLLSLIIAVAFTAWGVWGFSKQRAANHQMARLHASLTVAQEHVQKRDRLLAERDQMVEAAGVRKRLRGPLPVTCVLTAIEAALPPGVTLSSMDMERVIPGNPLIWSSQEEATLDSQLPSANQTIVVELRGIATSDMNVARFAQQLGRDPLFVDVKITEGTKYETGAIVGRRFVIRADIPLKRKFVFTSNEGA